MVPTAEQLDELFRAGTMKRLGIGSRRSCYAIPGTGLCVKCYRSDEEIALGKHVGYEPFKPLAASVAREIRRYRFDEKNNICCQECRYWHLLRRRLPINLMAAFPSVVEQVFVPSRGWCEVETLLANSDGSPVVKFHEFWATASVSERQRLFAAFESFSEELTHYAVRFYDPQNVLVQKCSNGSFRFRITDFEPSSRTWIALDRLFPALARFKSRRRFARYRKMHQIERPASVDDVPTNAPMKVNVLCLKWGDYYGPEYVNRLYAGVKRNLKRPFRFVCVTDCPEGLAEGIESVPLPEDPKMVCSRWPNIFVKLCLFKDGFANLVGPTLFLDIDLLVTGPLDRFFDYRPGEFCIVRNWVERRKLLFRKSPLIGNSSCFRFEAGRSGDVYNTFMAEKDDTTQVERFLFGSQKFQTYAMRKAGKVNWWPDDWVCSFKRRLVPLYPLNKIFEPWRPPKTASIVAFHGQPDIPQAIAGYYLKYGKPVKPHLTCRPTKWIMDYWHE